MKVKKIVLMSLIFIPVILGWALYLLSKLIKSLGYLLMSYKESAKDELYDFWSIEHSLGDI